MRAALYAASLQRGFRPARMELAMLAVRNLCAGGDRVVSRAAEAYLSAIYEIEESSGRATTSAVAAQLGVSNPSVTRMMKKLAATELLRHAPYHGVELTPYGKLLAINIVRRRRLIERYLTGFLGYSSEEVRAEAVHLEHAISEKLEDRLAAILDQASQDHI